MQLRTISPEHRKRYADYFSGRGDTMPVRPHRWQEQFECIAEQVGAETVLDYGCGPTACLAAFSNLNITNYDPAVPEFSRRRRGRFDLVVCNQVLEHAEPECVDAVIEDIRRYTGKAALISVSTEQSSKKLDGAEWHSFVREPAWWHAKFMEEFPGCEFVNLGGRESDVVILWKRDVA